jgi:hypothetical protein
MDENDSTGALAAFSRLVTTASEREPPQRRNKRRNGSKNGSGPAASGSRENTGTPAAGENGNPVQSVSRVEERDSQAVLKYIASLSGRKDRFKELETALWENVDVLVPSVMSMAVWTQSLNALRDSNEERERGDPNSADPLGAIRQFLSGKEQVQ